MHAHPPDHANVTTSAKGSDLCRTPVSAKIALANAGAAGGVPGSPMPRIGPPEARMVTFIGGWRPEWEKVLRALTDNHLKIWGPGWDRECPDKDLVRRFWQGRALRGVEFAKAVAASKVNLNVIEMTNRSAANMRFFEVPMCGGLQWVSSCSEMAQEYRHGEHLFYFDEGVDMQSALCPILADDQLRASVAAAGHRLTRERHTYEHRARALLTELGIG